MATVRSNESNRPRELRRRVILPARLRTPAGWSDACILNISSRGLLIQSGRPVGEGSTIEIWHGERLIVARVVWRQGLRVGLSAEGRLPVEDIVGLAQAPALRPTAAWPERERRKRPRTHDDSRLRGRAMEFATIAIVSASLAVGGFALVQEALARPLAYVEAALQR